MTAVYPLFKFTLHHVVLTICLINLHVSFSQEIQHLNVTTSPIYASIKGEHEFLSNKHIVLCEDKVVALKKGNDGYIIQHFDTANLTLTYSSAPIEISNNKFYGLKLMKVNNRIFFIGYEPISRVNGTNFQHPINLPPEYAQKNKHNWKYLCYTFGEDYKSIDTSPKEIRDLSTIGCLRPHDSESLITAVHRTNFNAGNQFEYVIDFYNLSFEIIDSLKFKKSEELVDYKIIENSLIGIIVDNSKQNPNTSIINYDLSSKKITQKTLHDSLGGLIQSKLLIAQNRMFILSTSPNLIENAPFERTIYKPSKLTLVELELNGTFISKKEHEINPFAAYSKRGTSGSEINKMNIDIVEAKNDHILLVISFLIKDGSSYTPIFALDYPYGSSLILRIPTSDSLEEIQQRLIHKTQLFDRLMFDVGNFMVTRGESLHFFYVDYIKKHPKEDDIYYSAKPNGSGLVGYEVTENGTLTPYIAFDKKNVNGLQIEAFSPRNMIQLGDKIVVEVAVKGGKENVWIIISLD